MTVRYKAKRAKGSQMAKIVIQHDVDPSIGIVLEEVPPGSPAVRWHGACTECGHVIHRWHPDNAIAAAKRHVDRHESGL